MEKKREQRDEKQTKRNFMQFNQCLLFSLNWIIYSERKRRAHSQPRIRINWLAARENREKQPYKYFIDLIHLVIFIWSSRFPCVCLMCMRLTTLTSNVNYGFCIGLWLVEGIFNYLSHKLIETHVFGSYNVSLIIIVIQINVVDHTSMAVATAAAAAVPIFIVTKTC